MAPADWGDCLMPRNFVPFGEWTPDLPEFLSLPCENPEDGFIRFPARRLIEICKVIGDQDDNRARGAP